ncbi:uncharacterized protein FTOL_07655 [Fusarium torulosum]|uniref:Cytochrome P450 monooxygenase n=1 Tax=Fusarium torulosum TaxID=33205 RepID=A0AAE8MB67_9HYPO|nr:uncharacterized protein FTOL_07655 [Fusarium torulosum]
MAFVSVDTITFSQIVLSTVIFLLAITIVYSEIKYYGLRNIPGPLLGRYTDAWRCYLAWKFKDRPGGVAYHQHIHQRYGDVVRVGPKTVYVNDPSAIPVVLGFKDRLDKTDSVDAFGAPGMPPILFSMRDSKQHGAYRRAIQTVYSTSTVMLYQPAVDDMIKKFTTILDKKSRAGEKINLAEWCSYFVYDTIINVSYGTPLGFLDEGKDVYGLIETQAKTIAYVRLATQWRTLDYVLRTNPLTMALTRQKENAFFQFSAERIQEAINKPKENKIRKPTMLQQFLDAQEKFPDLLTDQYVHIFCTTNLLAGTVGPTIALDCILAWMARSPEEQSRLHQEIAANSESFPVTWKETDNMPYLQGVLREGNRLAYSSDLGIEREAPANGLILPSGHVIPAGYSISVSQPALLKNRDAFGDDALEFIPERWMKRKDETEDEYKDRKSYMDRTDLSFGAGSRICPGIAFSRMELSKLVASIVVRYKA